MNPTERAAGAEFDRWAEEGRAESMETGHGDVTEQLLATWTLTADSHLLDVGCGNGWAVRRALAEGAGAATGVDVSTAMIGRAANGPGTFQIATAQSLPFGDGAFSHILSVEALYYAPDPGASLAEWRRVARPGARLGIIVDLYRESPGTHAWVDALPIPAHLFSEAEYREMAAVAGWQNVTTRRLHDRRPPRAEADFTTSAYWPGYDQYLAFRRAGSLAIEAVR